MRDLSALPTTVSFAQLSESLHKAYCISDVSEEDTTDLIEALTKIRSLLCVKLGSEEEGMIIKGLKYGYSSSTC